MPVIYIYLFLCYDQIDNSAVFIDWIGDTTTLNMHILGSMYIHCVAARPVSSIYSIHYLGTACAIYLRSIYMSLSCACSSIIESTEVIN